MRLPFLPTTCKTLLSLKRQSDVSRVFCPPRARRERSDFRCSLSPLMQLSGASLKSRRRPFSSPPEERRCKGRVFGKRRRRALLQAAARVTGSLSTTASLSGRVSDFPAPSLLPLPHRREVQLFEKAPFLSSPLRCFESPSSGSSKWEKERCNTPFWLRASDGADSSRLCLALLKIHDASPCLPPVAAAAVSEGLLQVARRDWSLTLPEEEEPLLLAAGTRGGLGAQSDEAAQGGASSKAQRSLESFAAFVTASSASAAAASRTTGTSGAGVTGAPEKSSAREAAPGKGEATSSSDQKESHRDAPAGEEGSPLPERAARDATERRPSRTSPLAEEAFGVDAFAESFIAEPPAPPEGGLFRRSDGEFVRVSRSEAAVRVLGEVRRGGAETEGAQLTVFFVNFNGLSLARSSSTKWTPITSLQMRESLREIRLLRLPHGRPLSLCKSFSRDAVQELWFAPLRTRFRSSRKDFCTCSSDSPPRKTRRVPVSPRPSTPPFLSSLR